MNKIKNCPVCGDSFRGRIDKKYCSDQCRATANNQNRKKSEKAILATNRVLRKNRTILKTLCPIGKATVRKSVLDSMGYDYDIFSSLFMANNGNLYYLCYDYGFSPIVQKGVERALIITRQNYVGTWQPWKFIK